MLNLNYPKNIEIGLREFESVLQVVYNGNADYNRVESGLRASRDLMSIDYNREHYAKLLIMWVVVADSLGYK